MNKVVLMIKILIASFLLGGCTTAMYADKSLPDSEIALIKSDDAIILFVDDIEVPYSGGNYAKIKVLPGMRKITVRLNDIDQHRSAIMHQSTYFNALGGDTYIVKPQYRDIYWFPVIINEATGEVISSKKKLNSCSKKLWVSPKLFSK
ncbi:hypothetical protein [Pelagibaculum spongiae]|uniref:DUF2846 domain-containing protein n=1 Tax=Pelagibaculum spongiae TaxID=2080658 RepID=A0A2V1H1V1_9GAMM|nr:hypothetical protein [Pelagibaculum spongiae]PVZ69660.1 hypothetical protein DC094_10180 [Pelagibaculum spongiae]